MRPLRAPLAAGLIVLLSLSTLAAPAEKGNAYDKFRKRRYSNEGLMRQEDEIRLAAQFHEELQLQNQFVTDRRVVDYVNRVGRAVAARSRRPDLEYQFYVVDDDQVNAFTTGGGRVYIFTGMLRRMSSEGELAAVFSHEIGHVVGRHVLKNIKSSQKWSIPIIIGAVLGGQGGATVGALLAGGVVGRHSRDAEREADYLGLYNLRDAGYDVEEMNNTWRLLEAVQEREPSAVDKIFASHPAPRERLRNTELEIQQHLAGSPGQGKRNSAEFDQIKSLLGGRRVPGGRIPGEPGPAGPDPRAPEDPARIPGVPSDEAAENIPHIEEARAALRRNRYQRGARVVGTQRGDAFGDGRDALVVVFQYEGQYRALVTAGGEDYALAVTRDNLGLPLESFESIQIAVAARSRRPAIIIASSSTRLRWVWNGRDFDNFNIR